MFKRMTDAARRVIADAQAEVASMGHAEMDDDHLLLALAMGNDPAAELVAGRVEVAALHNHVAQARPQVRRGSGHIPLTHAAKSVLEHSLRQALRLGRKEVDTLALLLAMLDVKGKAVEALRALGVDTDELAQEAEVAADMAPDDAEEAVDISFTATVTASAEAIEEPGNLRPWPSPRCQGCRRLIRDHVRLRTLEVPDEATGKTERFRFLYCGACGTAFAIERVDS